MNQQEIKLIREFYINRYGGDLSKKSGVIAQENKPHFKNGQLKKIVHKIDSGINCLSPECLFYVKSKLNSSLHCDIKSTGHIEAPDCKLIEYSLNNKLKHNTGRGYVLAKNLSIYFLIKDGIEKANEMLNKFYQVQKIELKGKWVQWVQKNSKQNFSCAELRGWLRETQISDIEELTCWKCKNGKKNS